jgi:hypothetical protein
MPSKKNRVKTGREALFKRVPGVVVAAIAPPFRARKRQLGGQDAWRRPAAFSNNRAATLRQINSARMRIGGMQSMAIAARLASGRARLRPRFVSP